MGCFGCVVCSFALIVGVGFVFCYSDIWFWWWFDGVVDLCVCLLWVAAWVCVFYGVRVCLLVVRPGCDCFIR